MLKTIDRSIAVAETVNANIHLDEFRRYLACHTSSTNYHYHDLNVKQITNL